MHIGALAEGGAVRNEKFATNAIPSLEIPSDLGRSGGPSGGRASLLLGFLVRDSSALVPVQPD